MVSRVPRKVDGELYVHNTVAPTSMAYATMHDATPNSRVAANVTWPLVSE